MSCRVIFQLPKHSSINNYLAQLLWLKLQEHITYKVATIMYKCIHNIAPVYLTEIVLSEVPHNRNLRSTQRRLLYTTKSRTEFVHSGSFKSMGPHIWNTLCDGVKNSNNIDVFKSQLKTHLFSVSYH